MRGDAGRHLLHAFMMMRREHRAPDPASDSFPGQLRSQAHQRPEPARVSWPLDDHESSDPAVKETFEHLLSGMTKGVRGPEGIADGL